MLLFYLVSLFCVVDTAAFVDQLFGTSDDNRPLDQPSEIADFKTIYCL